MAAEVIEKPLSSSFKTSIIEGPKEYQLRFQVKGAADAAAAEAAFIAAIGTTVPATKNGLPILDYGADEEEKQNLFSFTATYGTITTGGGAPGESRISFNTSGATQHIQQSLSLQAIYGATEAESGLTKFIGQPIGARSDGVDGADIPVAIFEWEVTHTFEDADVDDAYISVIESLTGEVNIGTFKNRAAGEVLFLGASGQQVNEGPWDITFRFATSKNRGGSGNEITIGDITGIEKLGWELLDVRYKPQEQGTGDFKVVVQVPRIVLVHQVFALADFDDLGI